MVVVPGWGPVSVENCMPLMQDSGFIPLHHLLPSPKTASSRPESLVLGSLSSLQGANHLTFSPGGHKYLQNKYLHKNL